jgi:hypothetical protein
MKLYGICAALLLSGILSGPVVAQTNVQENKQTQRQLKQAHKADKAQAKADKAERKAAKSKKVKKAAKAQDKANREAGAVPQ